MKNVLVFPCGSEIGLEVNRSLAGSRHFALYGANSVDDHGKYVYKNYISGIPFIDAPNFVDEINKVVGKYNIDFIIPAHDSAVLTMAEEQEAINATVVTSCAHTCKICRSKKKTYEVFSNLIPTPTVYNTSQDIKYPVFLKPEVGQGSKGTQRVHTKEELEYYRRRDSTLLALEYLPGREYTVDCFTDYSGNLLFAEGRERRRISNGISVNSKRVDRPEFMNMARIINDTLSFQGVWFYQVKERADGELVLMEIAPRIAGTMALFRVMGVNFAQLSLYDRMKIDVSIMMNEVEVETDRALFARYEIAKDYDHVYIDFDDTVVVSGSVNTDIMKYLYQVRNMGKKVTLLTRHSGYIEETMADYAISRGLFDEVIVLDQGERKSQYICNENAIFIDDSFTERIEVYKARKIPCYGVDAVESLGMSRILCKRKVSSDGMRRGM